MALQFLKLFHNAAPAIAELPQKTSTLPLLRQQSWLRLLNLLPCGCLLIDDKLRICFANDNLMHFFPENKNKIERLSLIELVHDFEFENSVLSVLEKQQTKCYNFHCMQKQMLCKVHIHYCKREQQQASLLLFFEDISYLDQLERQQDDFIAEFCHELNSPIATSFTAIDLLEQGNQEKAPQLLKIIRSQLERLYRLSTQLLSVDRLRGAHHIEKVVINSTALLATVLHDYQLQAQKKKIILEQSGQDFNFYADQQQIRQVLINLLDNAIKYSPPESLVKLYAEKQERSVFLHVSDEGSGLSLRQQQQIRRRYYRLKSQEKGYGLGLSIAERILKAHGGQLQLSSVPQVGSTFTLFLPHALAE